MEITGQMRTELIELVRATRSIVDTGWPRDPTATPDIAQMENFLRANLVNTVASNFFYMMGRAAAGETNPPDAMDSLMALIRETHEAQQRESAHSEKLYEVLRENIASIKGLTAEVSRLAEKVDAEKVDAGPDEAERSSAPDQVSQLIGLVRESNALFSSLVSDIRELSRRNAESIDAMVRLTSVVEDLSAEVRAGRESEGP